MALTLTPRIAAFGADCLRVIFRDANYAHSRIPDHSTIAHFPSSKERETALNIIRWTYAVSGIPADSPRFRYYVSRWNVPGKVARAIADDTFDQITANCPPINPAWVALVPAALADWHAFNEKAHPQKAGISCTKRRAV